MAIHIDFREGTVAAWSSANPVLSQGEIGVVTDTPNFKIGDGVTAWNSLAYAPTGTSTQSIAYQSLGDGSDGNVTISSGTNTLTRDMYYNNLTINGTGSLNVAGYRVFVAGILDLTAAPAGAIESNGANGSNASGSTGGAGGAGVANGSIGGTEAGGAGANGVVGVGASGGAGTGGFNGGSSGASGLGGIGTSGAGGAASAATALTGQLFVRTFSTNFLRGAALVLGGSGGRGGSSGAGDGTNTGAGGGGGGAGGGDVALYANIILRSSSTAAGAIEALGGNGANGANATVGVTGGGAGGGGGGGGWVYIAYNYLAGPVVTNFIEANGGNGGNGGAGFGSASNIISGGGGGQGGFGGRITLFDIVTQATIEVYGSTSAAFVPNVTTGTAALFSAGGGGGVGGTTTLTI
jgi:hypothetical protein